MSQGAIPSKAAPGPSDVSQAPSPPDLHPQQGPPRSVWRSRRLWVGVLFSVACLVLAMVDINYREVAATLRSASLAWMVAAVLTVLVTGVAKAVRWRYLLYPGDRHSSGDERRLGTARLSNIWMAGASVNLAVPVLRSGDLLRAYFAGDAGGLSKSRVLGTVAAEKLLDLIMLAAFLVGLVLFVALPDELASRQGPILVVTLFMTITVAVVLWQRDRIFRLLEGVVARLPGGVAGPALSTAARAVDGLEGLRQPRRLAMLVVISVAIWSLSAVTNYVVFLALHMEASWVQAFFLMVVLQAGVALPSSPGKIGVFQVLCRWALGIFGVSASLGLAYGVALYVAAPLALMVTGAIALAFEGWRAGRLPADMGSSLSTGA